MLFYRVSVVPDSVTLLIVACQEPLSLGFLRQKYWSMLQRPPLRDLPNPGIQPVSHYVSWIGRWALYYWCHLGSPLSQLLFSPQVVSNSLQPCGLQHDSPPCPSSSPGICSTSWPLSRWCQPTISSVIPFTSCLQPFSASGSFLMSWLFILGGQNIGASALASVLPMNIQDWSPLRIDWFDLLAVQGTLRSLLQHHSSKASVLQCSDFFKVQLSHLNMTTEKTIALYGPFLAKWCLSFLICCLGLSYQSLRNKHLLISWLQALCAVILQPKKIKSVTVSIFPSSICHEVMGLDAMIFMIMKMPWSPLSPLSRSSLVLRFLPLGWYHLHVWDCWYFWQSWFQLMVHLAQPFAWCTLHLS